MRDLAPTDDDHAATQRGRAATVVLSMAVALAGTAVRANEPGPPPSDPQAAPSVPSPAPVPEDAAPAAAPSSTDVEELRQRIDELERRLAAQPPTAPSATQLHDLPPPPALRLQGYGEVQLALHDFGADQTREGGAQRDLRLTLDTTRFVLELIAPLPFDVEVEAEIELEHGGAGAALELEYEEFGEFELEVEKGGEVLLEELFLTKRIGDHVSVSAGRFYVAVGQLARRYRPVDYLAVARSEAETTVLPAVWDELGVELAAWVPWLRGTFQVVNGLDSTGFSSHRWIALGHQRRFELVSATDLAAVGRIDVFPAPDAEVGVAGYYGGTSRNRPKPDLVKDCPDGDVAAVAPCGFIDAPVALLDAHGAFRAGPVRGSALFLWGHLDNAAAVSARNERLSNALAVPRTPVADQAMLAWGEVGVDVGPWLALPAGHALEPFVRIDWYDTMFLPRPELFDNPRFERLVFTGGLSWSVADALVLKLDASHRRFATAALATEETVRASLGFVY